ncbi:MAG TPA: dockerin type I domain-containing protein, partial [Pirellulaceae bacterium]|nr:dockerin type I domain-containing protein [Pirellulaceae bacterium]
PPNEAGQKLHFAVTNDNNAFFAIQPTIDATGKLTFTPHPNVAGSAQVTVVLMDNGGTDNGGSDTSDLQTFTINITKAHVWHNAAKRLDVTGPTGLPDGHVVAGDALEIINFINAFGSKPVPTDGRATGPYCDVNADGSVAPNDALDVINAINAGQGGEGEGARSQGSGASSEQAPRGGMGMDELTALLAIDVASQPRRRR